jgi:DNA mismatch repair ATPase MutS
MLIHFWNKKHIMVYMESIPQLPLLSRIAKELALMNLIHESQSSVLHSAASINELKPLIRFFKFDTKVKSEIEALILLIWESIKIMFLIEPLVVFRVFKRLENKKDDIQRLFEYIGKIDSAISVAAMRKNISCFCKPVLIDTNHRLAFTDLYHPLIPDCVANSLAIKDKSILLTGSNMSGKTTFIRTIAINLLLGQTINTCFAKTFQFAQSRLFSAVRVSDDLVNDKSYYFEEIMIIKEMIINSASPVNHIFFLDEIYKGTNTVERIAAGKAILSFLAKSNNNIVFVSTHDIELTDLLADEYDLYHFTEVVDGENIHFDYQLKRGHLYTKNAIRILEINNYPKEIIREAQSISQSLINKHD